MPDITGDVASAIPIENFRLLAAALERDDRAHPGEMSHSFHCPRVGKNIPLNVTLKKLQFCDKKTF
ncbi:hypothetical protein [Rhizobium rhizogenes]|uniref:hypothetical protein n=1 Tax=Rhizobium rhizogenes TaxID=359 RepID=UPI0022C3410B|nr:hypothetical protein [Rhizobium rhizogenes]MCZ7465579.1 hypothetical protein [Rhizobium rhizogenes]